MVYRVSSWSGRRYQISEVEEARTIFDIERIARKRRYQIARVKNKKAKGLPGKNRRTNVKKKEETDQVVSIVSSCRR
jgi:hypothetical protein